jgi:hypothetical protein
MNEKYERARTTVNRFIRVKKEGKYAEVIFSTHIREAISAN